MKITIVGSGYVGLVTGACLAELGNKVTCIDTNKSTINKLNNAEVPFYEPGLSSMLIKAKDNHCIKFTSSYKKGLLNSEAIFVCVGTPAKKNGLPNLEYVSNVFISLAKNVENNSVIFIKSTVPVGTNRKMQSLFKKYNNNSTIKFASNPSNLV